MYLKLTGRLIINVSSLNTEGAVGNYISLSKAFIVRRTSNGYEYVEAPVISGNMIKHWHAVLLVDHALSSNYTKICDTCKRKIMFRSTMQRSSEFEYIKECLIEDVHGFLNLDQQIRRESIAKFSFLIPVEELEVKYSTITHNRVVTNKEGKVTEDMIVFKREHESGVFGFNIVVDLAYIGRAQSNPTQSLDSNERITRARLVVKALTDLLSGNFGAAQARALPIVKLEELIALLSSKPGPNLVHGYFKDYAEETFNIIKNYYINGEAKIYVLGERLKKIVPKEIEKKVKFVTSITEAFSDIEKSLSKLAGS